MIELGKTQALKVVRKVNFGVYLAKADETGEQERVLLPGKQVPEGTEIGDTLEVFIYRDSSDRMIATTRKPALELHQIGAFLSWGLEKDLLLPFREQTARVAKGQQVLAALYLDKSSRLCATMKVYPYLRTDSPYEKGDEVEGRIYDVSDNFGVFVAVDDQYSAMVPRQEAQGKFQPGQVMKFRVTAVREDGKINLSPRQKAYLQIQEDARLVMKAVDEYAGVLPFDDRVSPEIISCNLGLSKAAFKRAVGHLLKENRIELKNGKIFRR